MKVKEKDVKESISLVVVYLFVFAFQKYFLKKLIFYLFQINIF
jgi:hypothetical protein